MEVVGSYVIDDLLGSGGFASVYKGHHRTKHSKKVAIKIIRKETSRESQDTIINEIKISKKLTEIRHKNVIALFECMQNAHNVYMVMEYCNGGNLAKYLGVVGILNEETIRLFVKQLASALGVLYKLNIIHRDLKPENILLSYANTCEKLDPQPSEITLKIADFGVSKLVENSLTIFKPCGTLIYMAPEMRTTAIYDTKVDLWSLGVIIFKCLTRKFPFEEPNPHLNLSTIIPPNTSPELKKLLHGLLQYHAKNRICFYTLYSHPFLQIQQHNQLQNHHRQQQQQLFQLQ